MTRLVAAELRKVWRSRFFLVALAALLGANLFLLWVGTKPASSAFTPAAYHALCADIKGMDMPQMGEFLHESLRRAEAMSRIENVLRTEAWNGGTQDEYMRAQYAQEFSEFYEEYAAGNYLRYGDTLPREYTFLKTIVLEYVEVAGYDAFLDSIAQKAQQLSSISIFANSADGYDLANIEATARAFEGMRGIPIQYYPQRGLMTALDFALTDVVAVFAMLLLATVLVRFERDTGLLALIRSTQAGRGKTALAKLAALALSLAPVLVLLYGVNLIYCHACYGLGPLSRSVQSVPALMRTTLSLSVGQYIGLFLLTKWAAALAAGAWVMLAMLAAKRLFTGALAAGGFLALNLLVRSLVPATSRWNVLKYANLVSLLRTNEFLGRYHNLYWFGQPLALAVVTAATAVVCCTVFCALFCLVFMRGRLQAAQKLALRAPAPLRRFWARHARAGATPFGAELFKLFCVGGAALILCLFGAYQVYDAVQAESYIDADEIYYRYYMQNMQGPLRAETLGWLEQESEKFRPLVQLQSALASGSLSQAEYSALMMGYDSLQREMGTYQRVLAGAQRAAQLTRCQMVYDTGWLRLFDVADARDAADALAAALLCCVCFAGLFAMEKQTGMARVVCATPLGRSHTVKCKLRAAALACGVLTVLGVLPRFWVALRDYGLGCPFAPLYSLPAYAAMPELPLVLLVLFMLGARYAALRFMAGCVLALGQRTGSTFGAMFAAALPLCLPLLLSVCGLTGAKWPSVYPLFHIAAMFQTPGGAVGACFYLAAALGGIYLLNEYLYARFGRAQ